MFHLFYLIESLHHLIQKEDKPGAAFPGDAGGIEQNVNRWRRQLNLDPKKINQILENSQKTSSMLGEYFIFDLNNPDNNNSIVAALIPYSDNNQTVSETIFIKMNGSIMALQELKYEFTVTSIILNFNGLEVG